MRVSLVDGGNITVLINNKKSIPPSKRFTVTLMGKLAKPN